MTLYSGLIWHFLVGGLFMSAPVFAGTAYENTLLDRVTGFIDNRTIQVDLTEDAQSEQNKSGAPASIGIPPRHVQITCRNGCNREFQYSETLFDSPISAFRIDDNSNEFITIWEGGTTYVVRIYRILSDGAEKVFDRSSGTFPQFVYVKGGTPAVVLNGEGLTRPIHAGSKVELWGLADGSYQRLQ